MQYSIRSGKSHLHKKKMYSIDKYDGKKQYNKKLTQRNDYI